MSHNISFSIAANASAAEVRAMVDDIAAKFGLSKEVSKLSVTVDPLEASAEQVITAATPVGVTVDKNGLPWDERIHASTKTKNADGSWKKKKGASEELITQVTAELRQLMGTPVATTPAPVTSPAPVATTPTLPAITTPAPALPAVQESPYAAFTKFIGANLHSVENPTGRLTAQWVDETIAAFGVPGGMANLAARPDLIPTIQQHIASALAG